MISYISEPYWASDLDYCKTRNVDVCPAAKAPGFSLRPILGQSVGWLVCWFVGLMVCPFREAANANLEPIELGMVLNEGEDRKTLLRRGGPRQRCLFLEI